MGMGIRILRIDSEESGTNSALFCSLGWAVILLWEVSPILEKRLFSGEKGDGFDGRKKKKAGF